LVDIEVELISIRVGIAHASSLCVPR
jgi:hypothetical protein